MFENQIVYFGVLGGVITRVSSRTVDILFDDGRYRKNVSVKSLYLNKRWVLTNSVISVVKLKKMFMQKERMDVFAFNVEVNVDYADKPSEKAFLTVCAKDELHAMAEVQAIVRNDRGMVSVDNIVLSSDQFFALRKYKSAVG